MHKLGVYMAHSYYPSWPHVVRFLFQNMERFVSIETTINVWKGTIAYNLALMVILFATIGLEGWPPALFMLVSAGFAGVAWRILWEKKWEEENEYTKN